MSYGLCLCLATSPTDRPWHAGCLSGLVSALFVSMDLPGDCWAVAYPGCLTRPACPPCPDTTVLLPGYPGTSLCWAMLLSPVLTHTSLVALIWAIHPPQVMGQGENSNKANQRRAVKVITIFSHHLILWKIKYIAFWDRIEALRDLFFLADQASTRKPFKNYRRAWVGRDLKDLVPTTAHGLGCHPLN